MSNRDRDRDTNRTKGEKYNDHSNRRKRDREYRDYNEELHHHNPNNRDRDRSRDRDREDKSNYRNKYSKLEDQRGDRDVQVQRPKEVWGKPQDALPTEQKQPDNEIVKEKVNFGLSGALARDAVTGNMRNGVVLKFSTPLDEAMPTKHWRLYVFKEGEIIDTLHIHRQASYCIGRDDRVADIVVAHPSISKQHCVLQFRAVSSNKKSIVTDGIIDIDSDLNPDVVVKPYLMDLSSANKTFVNNNPIEEARYYELLEKDSIRFGFSTREYVLLSA